MPIPSIGAEDVKAGIYGFTYTCFFVVNSSINMFLLSVAAKYRKDIFLDWKRNPWRAGMEVCLGSGFLFLLAWAMFWCGT